MLTELVQWAWDEDGSVCNRTISREQYRDADFSGVEFQNVVTTNDTQHFLVRQSQYLIGS